MPINPFGQVQVYELQDVSTALHWPLLMQGLGEQGSGKAGLEIKSIQTSERFNKVLHLNHSLLIL